MKLIDFVCNNCNTRFEELVKDDFSVVFCPKCKSSDVKRVISGFATLGAKKSSSSSASCSANKGFS